MSSLDDLSDQMSCTSLVESGVSFMGRALKLNSAKDARPVIEAIASCECMKYLNMEGNSVGVEAARVIGSALSSKTEVTRALWKDMFTGRLKSEIPRALDFLGQGLILSGAKLVELDLSDNAMGPIGIDGIVDLLTSPCCFTLQVLKLNNLGLGITGAQKLAAALDKLHRKCIDCHHRFDLRVFIAGRNRLENDGAIALARVFAKMSSLVEVSLPQNGIYYIGIKAMCDAFMNNPYLEIVNLNDNTITPKGASHLKNVLPHLRYLRVLDLGDCLLKTKGGLELCDAFSQLTRLKDVNLANNELAISAGLSIVNALASCPNIIVNLNGNRFGDGIDTVKNMARNYNIYLTTFSDDEGDDDIDLAEEGLEEEEEEEEEEELSEEEQTVDEDEYDDDDYYEEDEVEYDEDYGEEVVVDDNTEYSAQQDALERFKNSGKDFPSLGPNPGENIVDLIKERYYVSEFDRVSDFIKIMVLVANIDPVEENLSLLNETCNIIGSEVISWAAGDVVKTSFVINTLSAFLGFVKSEETIPAILDVDRAINMLKSVPFSKSLWITLDHCSRSIVK